MLCLVPACLPAATPAAPPVVVPPRQAGAPFLTVWRAEDYGAHPENSCVVQHPGTGFVYVGNSNGVLEFDGARWRTIPAPGGAVRALCIDSRGRIWGCTGAQIFRLDTDPLGAWRAQSMMAHLPPEFRVELNLFQGIAAAHGVYFRDGKNLILFGAGDAPAQVWRVADGSAVVLRLCVIDNEPYVTVGAPVNAILRRRGGVFERTNLTRSVLAARAEPGGGWQLLTVVAVQRWHGDELATLQEPLAGELAAQAAFLADGRCVFGTGRQGLIVCDRAGRRLQKIDRSRGLPANQVADAAPDREGGVWLALSDGIARVQLDSPYAVHGPAQGVEGRVHSLARHGADLFAGGTEGVVRRAPDGRFREVPGLSGSHREIVVNGPWLFTLSAQLHGLRPDQGNQARELENRNYYGLVPLAGWPGWYAHGSNDGLRWARFAGEKWTSEGSLRAWRGATPVLLEAPAGVVWNGNRSNGAARVDFRGGLRADAPVQHFHAAEGLPGAPGAMFLLDGRIVALAARRLVAFDEAAGRFEPETRIAGLDRFPIERAHLAGDDTLWLQGTAAVGREIRRVVPVVANTTNGHASIARWHAETLPGEPLRHLRPTTLFHDDATRTLWIGGHGALVSRDLDWQPAHAVAAPAAVVRRIETAAGRLLVAGGAAAVAPPGAFRPEQDALRVFFAAPAFVPDHAGVVQTEYRTRLDGLDAGWTAWSRQTVRDFTSLPWRDFTFRVQARDDAGRVGPEATLAVSIAPSWWATRWAWAGYSALGLLGIAGIVRLRTAALRRRAAQLEKTVANRTHELAHSNAQLATQNTELARLHRLELDEKIQAQLAEEKARLELLRYQLNPHFLLNAFTTLRSLVFSSPDAAGKTVERLAEFCRLALTRSDEDGATVGDEVRLIESYLDTEKARWRDELHVELVIDEAARARPLPPFLLQPLVENAIKYGSRTSPGTLRLRVSIRVAAEVTRPDAAAGLVASAATKQAATADLLIEIANTGEWVEGDSPLRHGSTGIGMENLRQRLRRKYRDAHEFTTEARDGWVFVRLRLGAAAAPAPAAAVRPPLGGAIR